MPINKRVTRYAIAYKGGLYAGQCLRRKDAVEEHVKARFLPETIKRDGIKKCWEECRSWGDRVVKAIIHYNY